MTNDAEKVERLLCIMVETIPKITMEFSMIFFGQEEQERKRRSSCLIINTNGWY